jgi:hypothetical protein
MDAFEALEASASAQHCIAVHDRGAWRLRAYHGV